jgi:hypothetical protein
MSGEIAGGSAWTINSRVRVDFASSIAFLNAGLDAVEKSEACMMRRFRFIPHPFERQALPSVPGKG